jgi:hypothetical protein
MNIMCGQNAEFWMLNEVLHVGTVSMNSGGWNTALGHRATTAC